MPEPATAPIRKTAWGEYVRRCAVRDEAALATLYDESSRLAYSIAMRILQNEADASEVVVDVYRQIWDSAPRFDELRGSAASWIVLLARSRAMDRLRFRNTRTRNLVNVEEVPDVACSRPSPESMAIGSQDRSSVARALAGIPQEQRETLELAFFAGLTHSEIAEHLQEPLGTVKTRIRLAVAKLREAMKEP